MLNKKIISSLFVLLIILTACSSNNLSEVDNVGDNTFVPLENFGQPNRTAELSGVVKSMIGNEIVVAIVEKQAGENAQTENVQNTPTAIGVTTTNIPGSGMGGGGANRDASISDADRLASLLERSTGQETVLVPVGIPMSKFSESEDTSRVEASLSDLTVGKMISVWLNSDVPNKKVAEFVSIK